MRERLRRMDHNMGQVGMCLEQREGKGVGEDGTEMLRGTLKLRWRTKEA
jgi:hypothetical protein